MTIRECVDEFTADGLATVFRARQPLDDGQLRRIVDRSITRCVTRRDIPPDVSEAPSAPILAVNETPTSPPRPLAHGPPTLADSTTATPPDLDDAPIPSLFQLSTDSTSE